jgi:hypothetical protein
LNPLPLNAETPICADNPVQEEGRAVVPGGLEQRRGDQVADLAGREQVLGREQPGGAARAGTVAASPAPLTCSPGWRAGGALSRARVREFAETVDMTVMLSPGAAALML